jgi:hypothetical protein
LLIIAAAKLHPIAASGTQIVVAETLLNIGIAVADALPMRRVVLPVVADVGDPVVVNVRRVRRISTA